MARRTIKALKKGRSAAMERRRGWEGGWRDAYRFVLPMRDILDKTQPGQPKGTVVFDSTAISSAANTVARLVQNLFPPFRSFIELKPGPLVPDAQKEQALELFEKASASFHAAIDRSNFGIVIHEFMYELLIGTGVMLFQEGTDDDPFNFIPVATPSVALEEGPFGTVGGLYRDYELPVSVLDEMWPDLKMPDDWATLLKDKPTETVKFFEATYFDTDKREHVYVLFRDQDDEPLLDKERIYNRNPWLVARWMKAANEVNGRGPILYALPDIRTANKVVELILMNASLAVSGVYTGVDDGIFNPNTAKFIPGHILAVARNEGHPQGPTLAPLPRSGSFDVSELILADLRESIRRLLLDRGLPQQQGTPPSATEFIQRVRELATETGPAFGRIVKELAVPLTLRGLDILNRKGAIEFPFNIDGQVIQVNVTSPLAQQESLADVESVIQWLETSGIVGPEITALGVKVEDIPKWLGEKFGVPRELVRNEVEREEIVAAVASFMQQQQGQGAPGGGEQPT